MPRRTKVVATIGPASLPLLDELIAAGLDVARVNLSHGTHADHEAAVAAVRSAADRAGRSIGILVDLPGPKLRLGVLPEPQEPLAPGDRIRLTGVTAPGSAARLLPIDDPTVLPALRAGDRVLLADGELELRVEQEGADQVVAVVIRGGRPRSRAGVNVPAQRLPDSGLDASDLALLPHLHALAPDFVGQSFVRAAADVQALRRHLPPGIAIIAKIETRPAVDAIDAILAVADGIMVARGDLGVELPFEDVPLIQKAIVHAALAQGRPCIVATQMLESMVTAPRPTRAEASDVANAVLDGADAVMLSAETAVGAWPVLALEAAARICAAAHDHAAGPSTGRETTGVVPHETGLRAVAIAAVALARSDAQVRAIACRTRSGRTAEVLSALHPGVPIIALTPSAAVARRLALRHGIVPVAGEVGSDVASVASAAQVALAPRGAIVVLASRPDRDPADLVGVVRA